MAYNSNPTVGALGTTVEVSEIESLANGTMIVGDGAGAPTTVAAMTAYNGTLKHEIGGLEANVAAIADGGIVVGTGTGTMGIRAEVLTGGAAGFVKHELGGIEADISAIADGGILVGTGAGTMGIRASALTAGAAGYLKHEVGGLEADVSAYDGLVKISGGSSSAVTAPTGDIVGTTDTQTLSGKTLTAPKIADAGYVADANGNEQVIFNTTASAVNEIAVTNAATTNNPKIAASGETNVGLVLSGKGTRGVIADNAFTQKVVALTDGATPALDASLGNTFTLSAEGDREIAVPSNAVDGQKITIVHHANGAARALTLATGAGGFLFGATVTALTATESGKRDLIGCIYNSALSRWLVVAYAKGFTTA